MDGHLCATLRREWTVRVPVTVPLCLMSLKWYNCNVEVGTEAEFGVSCCSGYLPDCGKRSREN